MQALDKSSKRNNEARKYETAVEQLTEKIESGPRSKRRVILAGKNQEKLLNLDLHEKF